MPEYKLSQKAWEIDLSKINEGYLFPEMITYAENRNSAKSKLLKDYQYNISVVNKDLEPEDATYLNIPVIRCKAADKYHFEDKELTSAGIAQILEDRQRIAKLDEILNNDAIAYCYIRKGSYYRPNACGYTDFKHRAGVYSKVEAVKHAKGCSDIWLERIDIEEHNKMIQSEIRELTRQLIPTENA